MKNRERPRVILVSVKKQDPTEPGTVPGLQSKLAKVDLGSSDRCDGVVVGGF
jgi:hypothetical protein